VLTGDVTVREAVWSRRFEGDFLDFGGGEGGPPAASSETRFPLRFDIRILAPGTLRIQNNSTRIVANAELTLRGTYDRPLLFGRADIQRGEVIFEGNRYLVTRGTIDFNNPTRIEPFFDIEAETRVRVPGQTYRVVFHAVGTASRFVPDLSSDPPLPTVEILSLLFGEVRAPGDVELRSWQRADATEQELIQAWAARLLAGPITSEVGRVVEQTFGFDTVVITPSFGDPSAQSARLTPTARLTLGKRISNRLYLTFSRSLTTSTRDQILLFEYDQSDRLSWIVSQNEDRTYALDFRVRHTF
jgi:autotransporter translocation and assembly factor TamB